jgi:3-deoxy-manno-octulosonate cytidylyltransferase (CMP-KDO synthetase)
MSTAFTVVIPARYQSTRLPGKPLQMIAGKPMIQHVWEQACKSSAARVVVATDDARIESACQAIGAGLMIGLRHHHLGTECLAEVCQVLGLGADAIVVNVQGDEPLIPPVVIDQVAANLAASREAAMATLAEPIPDVQALFNPNVVKVVTDMHGLALTFSRAPLPHRYLCLPRRVPAGFRAVGPLLAREHRAPGATACPLAWRAYPRSRCRAGTPCRCRYA